MITLTPNPIDPTQVAEAVRSADAGAVVTFVGTVRGRTGERRTIALEYEAYRPMAEAELERLRAEAVERWRLTGCAIVHRTGRLEVGEASVAVAVSAPHRRAAFEAAEWLIHSLKQSVPIWKCEHYADGSTEWIHHGR
jgi:molybdopterin synthase catalytic subunit